LNRWGERFALVAPMVEGEFDAFFEKSETLNQSNFWLAPDLARKRFDFEFGEKCFC
jgi:hypothetical protein